MPHNLLNVTAKSLAYEHAQSAEKLFSDLSFTLGPGRHGLVGPNGIGKSTLVKILAGDLLPSSGELVCSHAVVFLEQWADRPPGTVGEFLSSLWESPLISPQIFGILLKQIPLERHLTVLSGGEWTRVRIAEALTKSQGLLIMDEPTNNLDKQARQFIIDFIKAFPGSLLVISHDRDLLSNMDSILELSRQGLNTYGGNYEFYQLQKEAEQILLDEKTERAREQKKKLEREHVEKLHSQEKRMRRGQKMADRGGIPRIIVGGLKRRAQETHARINRNEQLRVDSAKQGLRDLSNKSKQQSLLGLSISEVEVPEGKMIFEIEDLNVHFGESEKLWRENINLIMQGPQRWALAGANGSGKSTLLKLILGFQIENIRITGNLKKGQVQTAFLDQHYSLLNQKQTVLENVMEDSLFDPTETRNQLAQFQFMKDQVFQIVETLSGGEKLKASLAKILLAKNSPQLLVLDEPTNNLDIESLAVLEDALNSYTGALLVVSHDEVFLENVGITKIIEL